MKRYARTISELKKPVVLDGRYHHELIPKRLKALRDEDASRRDEVRRGRALALLLDELTRYEGRKTKLHRALARKMETWNVPVKNLSDEDLERAYNKLTKHLDFQYSKRDSKKSPFERMFISYFKKFAPRTPISHGTWIGNTTVDAFVISLCTDKGIGIAFEIDGKSHDEDIKGRKDEFKAEFLKDLGVMVHGIPNESVRESYVQNLINGFGTYRKTKRTPWREKRDFWRTVHIATLAFGGQRLGSLPYASEILKELLQVSPHQINELLPLVKRKKTKKFLFPSTLSKQRRDHLVWNGAELSASASQSVHKTRIEYEPPRST